MIPYDAPRYSLLLQCPNYTAPPKVARGCAYPKAVMGYGFVTGQETQALLVLLPVVFLSATHLEKGEQQQKPLLKTKTSKSNGIPSKKRPSKRIVMLGVIRDERKSYSLRMNYHLPTNTLSSAPMFRGKQSSNPYLAGCMFIGWMVIVITYFACRHRVYKTTTKWPYSRARSRFDVAVSQSITEGQVVRMRWCGVHFCKLGDIGEYRGISRISKV